MNHTLSTFCFLFLSVLPSLASTTHLLTSPDQQIQVSISLKNGTPHWSVTAGEDLLWNPSPLGVTPASQRYSAFKETDLTSSSHDSTWKPVWGKTSTIRNHYTESIWTLQETTAPQRKFQLIFRVFDHSVAVRYVIPSHPKKNKETITADLGELRFTGDHTCWSANGEHANHGPVVLSQYKGRQLPLTVQVHPHRYLAVLEANINNWAPISLKRTAPTSFRFQLPPSQVSLPAQSSWRVITIGKSPGDLLVNNTLTNLNPPPQQDFSWVKPGIAMWDWREWGAKTDDGFTYGLDMESWMRQIDFAAKHNLAYLLLDAGWYGLEFDPKEDPTTDRDHLVIQPNPNQPHLIRKPAPKDWKNPINIQKLIAYAKTKNVSIILYLNDAASQKHDIEYILSTYEQWGAVGIKYGFMRSTPQQKVLKTRRIVQLCAQHHLLCNFHDGPIAPSGERRTFPNFITREFCHAQSDGMRTFSPKTFCTTVFTNMLAGPLDMDNGLYAITDAKKKRPKIFSELYSTVVAETARVMITFSGLAVLPDTPEAYEAKANLFEFIAALPMTWDETRILHSNIGHLITTARRSGDDWFVASCCDEKGTTTPIKLDFLKPGATYTATLYEDGQNAHYKTNRESYTVKKIHVTSTTTLQAKLAGGGGHCIRITMQK